MIERAHQPELEDAEPSPKADPRAVALSGYWQKAHDAACVSVVLMTLLRDQLASGPDDIAAVYDTIRAAELIYADLGVAVKGIDAVVTTKGIA